MATTLEDALKKSLVEDRPGVEQKPQLELIGTFSVRMKGSTRRDKDPEEHQLRFPGTHVTAACCALFCALFCIVLWLNHRLVTEGGVDGNTPYVNIDYEPCQLTEKSGFRCCLRQGHMGNCMHASVGDVLACCVDTYCL